MTRSLQKLIFAACRDLGMTEEDRRAMQLSVTGKTSMSAMTERDLKLVIDRLRESGFEDRPRSTKRQGAPRADLRLIHVLWRKLEDAGEVRRPGRDGLNAFIRARFGKAWGTIPADVDMLRDWKQIDDVLQSLKDWGARAGIDFDWGAHRR